MTRTIGPARTAVSTTPWPCSTARRTVTASGRTTVALRDVCEAEESGDVLVERLRPELVGRGDLHHVPRAHHRHAVSERERLGLIVRHVDGGQPELVEQLRQLVEQPVAQPPVERPERLVEEKHAWFGGERSGQCDALLLAARERSDRAVLESGEADELEKLGGTRLDRVGLVAAHPQAEGDVAEDVAMGKESVVLEDEADAAPVRRNAVEVLAVEHDPARVRKLKAGDDSQQRRLAGAARTEHRDDLACRHVERRAVQRHLALEPNRDVLDPKHAQNHPPRCTRTRSTRSTETIVTAMSTTASA